MAARPSPQRKRTVVLGETFAEPDRNLAGDARDDDVRVLVKDDAQRLIAVLERQRDDVLIAGGNEEPRQFNRFAVVAGPVRLERSLGAEHHDDRRHRFPLGGAGDHPREPLTETLELVGDLAKACFGWFAEHDEVRRLDPEPVPGSSRRSGRQHHHHGEDDDAARTDAWRSHETADG